MAEDVGPIVKLTRLRRRLSVEAEDVKSPSTPSTPKKRGGRLAAKPQLELIDEHALENVPKRSTRKSIARDIVDVVDEKPVTPSRRSARIRSNTSILSDTPQNLNSPRAKRAARRNSQAGSDNEGSSTPVRQTRRTRKDSTSSLDKADAITSNKKSPSTDVIAEEAENNVNENKDSDNSSNKTPTRKSPRRLNKNGRRSGSSNPDETARNEENITLNSSISKVESKPFEEDSKSYELLPTMSHPIEGGQEDPPDQKKFQEPNLSITSRNLIKELDTKPKNVDNNHINRSLSSSEEIKNNLQSKRHRAKSWTSITKGSSSDTEIINKKNRTKNKSFSLSNTSADALLNNVEINNTSQLKENNEEIVTTLLNTSNTTKDKKSLLSIEKALNNVSTSENPNDSFKSNIETPKKLNHSNESNKENSTVSNSQEKTYSKISEKLFEEAPSSRIQALVYIDDSDSNTGSTGKPDTEKKSDDDQCVPVVEHQIVNNEATPSSHNETCEPMDIDETMPENVSIPDLQNKSLKSKRKSSVSIQQENETCANKSANESMIKSSMSISETQNLEKSENENKSTLILSQIKDLSTNELISKSPKVTINDGSNLVKLADKDLKTQCQNYSTSTPLQQKSNKKLGLPLNTSIISAQESKDIKETMNVSLKNNSNGTKAVDSNSDEDSSDSDEEEPKEKSVMIDDEAEEASDDYESGDSQDEHERQYEEENEIKEKGETLDSDEDMSNDTDYEKDSFIVSSDEEDNKLLSGSGDDLSLSDNELTMSAKSKNKFNKRMEKEQKKASKEMYESRHKINNSDRSSKSETPKPKKNNRMRLDSTLLDSDNEDVTDPLEKKKQLIIDSSQDISAKSEHDKSVSRKKKKTKRLSDSMCNDSIINEKEITIDSNGILDKNDPLSLQLKQEPKTPQKDLDISTVLITNAEEVEKVNVDENVIHNIVNETSDPLHVTMADNDEENYDSSSSDNAEHIQNYDSMLSELNKDVKKKQAKLWDISLNLNKKKKKKSNAAIVDQLNLTQTKKSKKTNPNEDVVNSAAIETRESKDTSTTDKPLANDVEDYSSDSIDMRLLFPEDSNDSESAYEKNKDSDVFIPLKRSEGKTDITEGLDTTNDLKEVSILNTSKNKNQNRKSSVSLSEKLESNDESVLNVSKIKGRKSTVCPQENDLPNTSQPKEESVLNVSKIKGRKYSVCPQENDLAKPADEESAFLGFYMDTTGTGLDTSLKNSAKKNKKKNNSMSTSANDLETEHNVSVKENTIEIGQTSEKKRKSKQPSDSDLIMATSHLQTDPCDDDDAPLEISYQSEKKKKSKLGLDSSQTTHNETAEIVNTTPNTSHRKKNKSKQILNSSQIIVDSHAGTSDYVPAVQTSQKDKKTKNKSISDTAQSDIEIQGAEKDKSINCSINSSDKKKKNKVSIVAEISETVKPIDVIQSTQSNANNMDQSSVENAVDIPKNKDDKHESHEEKVSSKKRKRKSSGEPREGELVNASKTLSESLTTNSLKKKQKVMSNYEAQPSDSPDKSNTEKIILAQEDTSAKKSKKNKYLADQENIIQCAVPVNEISKKSRKRKEREDDNGGKVSKVFKENSFDKVHVTRLPASLLNQLDDKLKVVLAVKKSNPVATTNFVVEETRKKKSKPSNYLEESVYLNESPKDVKQKASLKKPKVLPFIPTASTSASGFTTNFRVNQISNETKFIAQSSNIMNFKNDYLQNKRIKKLGTYEMYKKGRNIKLSKF